MINTQKPLFHLFNNVRTKDGGTHEVGFKTGFTRVFNEYARKIGELKDKDKTLKAQTFVKV